MNRILAVLSLLTFAMSVTSPALAGEVSHGLESLINDRGLVATDEIKVLVVMKNPGDVDIPQLDADLRALSAPMSLRHRRVVETLRDAANVTQVDIVNELENRKVLGTVAGYTSHWLINSVVVQTTVEGARELAARPDVDTVEPDLVTELIRPAAGITKHSELRGGLGLLPGIEAVQADRVWLELGIDGTGALVGNMDTGVDGAHPALSSRWRGNTEPASECWRDGADFGHSSPRDLHSHGTHVMGTITGFAPGDSIGVAPGALWIADNSINQGAGSEFDNDVLASLEWFADPDGDPGTTDDVPDVVQNSWGVNEDFSGYIDCDSRWWAAIDNCEAAGVVLTWSAGNEGPGSETHRSPADRADSPFNSFSVGSTLTSAPYAISDFSSRGPSGCGGPFAMKPEISAPGSGILSSVPGGGYDFKSGTSMAGPHVAGVVALMRAANPDLDVQTVKQVIMDTAIDLGSPGEDNTYGHGFINAYEAVLAVLDGYGSIEGTVTDLSTGLPIAGATVDIVGDTRSVVTDGSGFYRLTLPEDSYTLEYSAFGYVTDTASYSVLADTATDGDFTLIVAPSASLTGTVTDFSGATVAGATITVLDAPIVPVTTQPDGTYALTLPDLATYDVRAALTGLGPDTQSVTMSGDTVQDFTLSQLTWEGFETGDFTGLPWELGGTAPWFIDTSDPHEGTYAVRSGSISHDQVSWMEVELMLANPGDVEFAYKVSSESNYDYLRFYIDGFEQESWAGSIDWTETTFAVDAGTHVFRWAYTKDGSVSTGADAAWVDSIIFPPSGMPDIDVSPSELTESLGPDESVDRDLTLTNSGTVSLSFSTSISGFPAGSWVVANPTSGTVSAGSQESITVTFNSAGLFDGHYLANLRVVSNDPDESPWNVPMSLTVTGVVGTEEVSVPLAWGLGRATPNPFGTRTALRFDVPESGAAVELSVFDVTGRHVRTLLSGAQPAGQHVVLWDGRDSAESRVAPGVYFYRLRAEGFEQTKRLIRLR